LVRRFFAYKSAVSFCAKNSLYFTNFAKKAAFYCTKQKLSKKTKKKRTKVRKYFAVSKNTPIFASRNQTSALTKKINTS